MDGTTSSATVVPLRVIRWYRLHRYDGTASPILSGKTWKDEIPDDANDQTMQLNTSRNMQLFEDNCERLNRLAKLCKQRNIRMVIVIPPVHSLYGIHSSKEQWKVVDDFLVSLSTRWEHVEYGNYSHDSRFTDEDFYDGNHLNSDIGGTKFSLIVKEDFAL